VKYNEIHLDWRDLKPRVEYSNSSITLPNSHKDANSERLAKDRIHHLVDEAVRPHLAAGWRMDGSFDQCVRVDWQNRSTLVNAFTRAIGAWVRLRFEDAPDGATKVCPDCAETILVADRICRF